MIAIAANDPPKDKDPVSPQKFLLVVHYTKESLNKPQLLIAKMDNSQHLGYIVSADTQKKLCFNYIRN